MMTIMTMTTTILTLPCSWGKLLTKALPSLFQAFSGLLTSLRTKKKHVVLSFLGCHGRGIVER